MPPARSTARRALAFEDPSLAEGDPAGLALPVLAVVVGVLIGMAGVGGVLLPPGLVALGDLTANEATATSTWAFVFTGVVGTIAYACAAAGETLPAGVRAFPVNYWDGLTPEQAGEFFGPTNGLHANKGETSAVMAINPDLVDLDAAVAEMLPFPEVTSMGAVHTAFFFASPGSVHRATQSGTWGDPRESNVEFRWDVFNLFNHPGFGFPNAAIGNPNAGRIATTIVDNRSMQFALKLNF